MSESGIRAAIRRYFYRTLWALGRHYCDDMQCPTVAQTNRGHYAWWHHAGPQG